MHLANEEATLAAGQKLAGALPDRLTVFLCGDLGAGKTTLTRGLLRGLGYTGHRQGKESNLYLGRTL